MIISPSFSQFKKMSKQGNLIPVYGELLADLDTPVSTYLKANRGKRGFLLESVEGGKTQARYSFVGINPEICIDHNGAGNPLDVLAKFMKKHRYVPIRNLPRFAGGAVGYLSYDANENFDQIKPMKGKAEGPKMRFMIAYDLIIIDHLMRKQKVVTHVNLSKKLLNDSDLRSLYNAATKKIKKMSDTLTSTTLSSNSFSKRRTKQKFTVKTNMSSAAFRKNVQKIKHHIRIGDVIQVVYSQQFQTKITSDAFSVYRCLRSINPSPYMFYLDFEDTQMVGASPEMHVRCQNGEVELRPIAGTRKRGKDAKDDKQLEDELLSDPKERAEHVMLVDLGRNDLGRVCKTGSVKVEEFMAIEKYSHVIHMVSRVKGVLAQNKNVYDVIRSTFPAGTVSGAPKIKAMELISKFEPKKRGPYAGLVGYLSFCGNFDSAITIRTIVVKGDKAVVQAGAGIVADSKPKNEELETVNKSKGLLKAIELSERGVL